MEITMMQLWQRLQSTVLSLTIALLWTVAIRTTRADEVLDQSFVPRLENLSAGANQNADEAQTFTVGIAGTLTRIEVFVYRVGDPGEAILLLDVRPTVNSVPVEDDSQILASADIPVSVLPELPAFTSLDISAAGLSVAEGDVLAIVLRSNLPPTSIVYWRGDAPGNEDPYPDGEWFTRNRPIGSWTSGVFGPADLGFQTFVDPGS